jgi:hypothetical protein
MVRCQDAGEMDMQLHAFAREGFALVAAVYVNHSDYWLLFFTRTTPEPEAL